MKNSMRDALMSSIKTEEEHINDRFAKADSLLSKSREPEPIKQLAVRDTFSMPPEDNNIISQIRLRCMKAGIDTTRSEIVRVAIHEIANLSQEEFEKKIFQLKKVRPRPRRNG